MINVVPSWESILQEGISEVIMTTVSSIGTPNAAPIGVIRRGRELRLRLFEGSHTISNLRESRLAVAHITHDPWIFVLSLLGDLEENAPQPHDYVFEWVEFGGYTAIPVLKAEARVFMECSEYQMENHRDSRHTIFLAEPIRVEVVGNPIAHNRAFSALIEACILASRYVIFWEETMLSQIRSKESIIKRCGSADIVAAFEHLVRILEEYGVRKGV